MVYLVCPEMVLLWIDLAASVCFQAAEIGVDLAGLSWLPSRRHWDEETLSLALAHGAACSAGIIVGGEVFHTVDRARKLQGFYLQLRRILAGPEAGKVSVDPGSRQWTAVEESLDKKSLHEWAEVLAEARTEAAMLLAQEPRPELLEHWSSLSGSRQPSRPSLKKRK
jgi:hypothetical protein